MGPHDARGVAAARRPKWRAYLLLSRVSNLPTVWTNVLAGIVSSRHTVEGAPIVATAAAVSLLYTAGMFLNDAFDADADAAERPDRPVPAGDVTRREAFSIGFTLIAGGLIVLALRTTAAAAVWAAALAAAIVSYDYRHKGDPVAPLIMGLCRGLVYGVAAAAAFPAVPARTLIAGGGLAMYVVALTVVAKRQARPVVVAILIAGISLVDAAVIGLNGGSLTLVAIAAAGFPLTLFLQRLVPGT